MKVFLSLTGFEGLCLQNIDKDNMYVQGEDKAEGDRIFFPERAR